MRQSLNARKLIPLFIGVLGITIGIKIILYLPGIPYNVQELFQSQGSVFIIAIFSLAVLWVGMSGAWLGKKIAISSKPYFSIPGWMFFSGMVSFLLLSASVTKESLSDIVGSSIIHYWVVKQRTLGDLGTALFSWLSLEHVIAVVEKIGRYIALYGPVVLCLGIFHAGWEKLSERGFAVATGKFFLYALYALPWFFLCKVIAFDFSSTDNLNELIARPGHYGIGGGGYLYLLLILISSNSVLLAKVNMLQLRQVLFALAFTLITIPLGWWLFNHGLVTNFKKYRTVYSGVDFLLGPDREHLLSSLELFLRWSGLQLATVSVLAYGARVLPQKIRHLQ